MKYLKGTADWQYLSLRLMDSVAYAKDRYVHIADIRQNGLLVVTYCGLTLDLDELEYPTRLGYIRDLYLYRKSNRQYRQGLTSKNVFGVHYTGVVKRQFLGTKELCNILNRGEFTNEVVRPLKKSPDWAWRYHSEEKKGLLFMGRQVASVRKGVKLKYDNLKLKDPVDRVLHAEGELEW